jgi:TAK1-binding protein 1
MQQVQDECGAGTFHSRDDMTVILRNFNFPMPNAIKKRKSQSSSSTELTGNTFPNVSYCNNNNNNSSSTTSSGRQESEIDLHRKIKSYVDFTDYFNNVKEARRNGTLPIGIDFD